MGRSNPGRVGSELSRNQKESGLWFEFEMEKRVCDETRQLFFFLNGPPGFLETEHSDWGTRCVSGVLW